MKIADDPRCVLTLDAGGTSFRFSAMRSGVAVTDTFVTPSDGNDLDQCLDHLVRGFTHVMGQCPTRPVAISFAFPGPADYPRGIIGDLTNLPAFRGGVALGPMLETIFGIPVLINNDADLFTYGEAMGGLLPYVNNLLARGGSPKCYRNLLGITLGTGLGGGIVVRGELLGGDNSGAGEICMLRNKLSPSMHAEEGASIRAVRRAYSEQVGIPLEETPDPRVISQIAQGEAPGNQAAACEAYRRMGQVVGDAVAHALTLVDGLVVIGGGLSKAWPLFMPALMDELNANYTGPTGRTYRRLVPVAFNLQDAAQTNLFIKGGTREIQVPFGGRRISYDPLIRTGVGISRLGTSEATALGAYAMALRHIG